MFKRIIYEEWTSVVPILSFLLTAGVFFFVTIRALFLSKDRCQSLASLPLNDTDNENEPSL